MCNNFIFWDMKKEELVYLENSDFVWYIHIYWKHFFCYFWIFLNPTVSISFGNQLCNEKLKINWIFDDDERKQFSKPWLTTEDFKNEFMFSLVVSFFFVLYSAVLKTVCLENYVCVLFLYWHFYVYILFNISILVAIFETFLNHLKWSMTLYLKFKTLFVIIISIKKITTQITHRPVWTFFKNGFLLGMNEYIIEMTEITN